jgi:DNA-binding transcriptional regulator YiaG
MQNGKKTPRIPYRKEVYLTEDGDVLITQSGAMGLKFANLYAPSPGVARAMIRALRERKKWSQAMLAAILGVPLGTVRRWEAGTRNPCGAARKLIWIMWRSFTGKKLPDDLFHWVTWGRLWDGGRT